MGEPVPLAEIHRAVLDLLRGVDDAVLFGAQAVNAYVGDPRMTQDGDILSSRTADLALLLLAFPDLKTNLGPVRGRLEAAGADAAALTAWEDLVAEEIRRGEEEEDFA